MRNFGCERIHARTGKQQKNQSQKNVHERDDYLGCLPRRIVLIPTGIQEVAGWAMRNGYFRHYFVERSNTFVFHSRRKFGLQLCARQSEL